MQACPACAQEWERRRQLQAMLGCFRGQAPDFPAEVIRRLRAEEAARRRRQWVRMGAAAAACVVLVLGTLFGRQHSKEIARDVAEPACYAADEGRPLDEMEQEAVICMTAADRDWIADALACRLGDRAAEYMRRSRRGISGCKASPPMPRACGRSCGSGDMRCRKGRRRFFCASKKNNRARNRQSCIGYTKREVIQHCPIAERFILRIWTRCVGRNRAGCVRC